MIRFVHNLTYINFIKHQFRLNGGFLCVPSQEFHFKPSDRFQKTSCLWINYTNVLKTNRQKIVAILPFEIFLALWFLSLFHESSQSQYYFQYWLCFTFQHPKPRTKKSIILNQQFCSHTCKGRCVWCRKYFEILRSFSYVGCK